MVVVVVVVVVCAVFGLFGDVACHVITCFGRCLAQASMGTSSHLDLTHMWPNGTTVKRVIIDTMLMSRSRVLLSFMYIFSTLN